MTTIPERFASDWFAANMRRLLSTMRGRFVWWCNVPPAFGATGEPYVVTDKVKQLLADFSNFRLFRTPQDYGPITKVMGPWHNPQIPMTAPLLVCDDDVQYLPEFVRVAAAHFARDPSHVYTFCGDGVTGFCGYVVAKRLCARIFDNMPASCRRIDDDLLNLHFKGLIKPIAYCGRTDRTCTIDTSDWGDWHTDKHTALGRDVRMFMVTACRRDFHREQNQVQVQEQARAQVHVQSREN